MQDRINHIQRISYTGNPHLRPTFEQLVSLPVPQLTPPERTIETSRPDPNVFDFHKGMMGEQQNLMHMHAMQQMMMRQEAQAQGADINVMRDLTRSAQELNRTMQDIAGREGLAARAAQQLHR